MSKELGRINTEGNVPVPDDELMHLADRIVALVEDGKRQLAVSINQIVKTTYWNVGRYIVEFEQQGNAKAKYGTSLLTRLAQILRARVGRGYSRPNLNNMRKFYLMFPICQTSDKYGMDSNLFVSKYELFLPNKEEWRRLVKAILK